MLQPANPEQNVQAINGNGNNNNDSGNDNYGAGSGNGNGDAVFADADGNEISRTGKWIATILLIFFTVGASLFIVGHWPDKIPAPKDYTKPLYSVRWFHVHLVGIPDTGKIIYTSDSTIVAQIPGPVAKDSLQNDTAKEKKTGSSQPPAQVKKYPPEDGLLHINTLLLILVAAGGFMGNMIYIATSFTTFIGSGEFKRSWIMWYMLKPFTASGLAVGLYFVFRGGFLNMSDDSTNLNLYGVMTLSILAGLFTDRATLKLKEVFDVLLKPGEPRPDPLGNTEVKITGVTGGTLTKQKNNALVLTGTNLDKSAMAIQIDGLPVSKPVVTKTKISFNFDLPDTLMNKNELALLVSDEKGNTIYKDVLKIKIAPGN